MRGVYTGGTTSMAMLPDDEDAGLRSMPILGGLLIPSGGARCPSGSRSGAHCSRDARRRGGGGSSAPSSAVTTSIVGGGLPRRRSGRSAGLGVVPPLSDSRLGRP
jgi:hypothetical protein